MPSANLKSARDRSTKTYQSSLAYAFIGIGVGLAGTPASHSLTGSVPVKRVGMASGTADLQRTSAARSFNRS